MIDLMASRGGANEWSIDRKYAALKKKSKMKEMPRKMCCLLSNGISSIL
jgi:hypothetical protein